MTKIVTMYKLIYPNDPIPELLVECNGFIRYTKEDTEHHDWLTQASFGKFDDEPSVKVNLDRWCTNVGMCATVRMLWRGVEGTHSSSEL